MTYFPLSRKLSILIFLIHTVSAGESQLYKSLYIVEIDGTILRTDLYGNVAKASNVTFAREVTAAVLSRDGTEMIVAGATKSVPVKILDLPDMTESSQVLPSFPALPTDADCEHGPSVLFSLGDSMTLLHDTGYGEAGGGRTLLIDENMSDVRFWGSVDLPGEDRLRMSPDGSRLIVAKNGLTLYDAKSGELLRSFGISFSYRQQGDKSVVLRGVDVDWEHAKIDLWLTRHSESGDKAERLIVGIVNGDVVTNKSVEPWPSTPFIYVGALNRDFRSKFFSGLHRPYAHGWPILNKIEAGALQRLQPQVLDSLPDEFEYTCYLSPDGGLLYVVLPRAELTNAGETAYSSEVRVIDTSTSKTSATFKTMAPIARILFANQNLDE